MNGLSELIMAEHSRSQADFIADVVLKHPNLISELINIVIADEEPISRRAAWPLRIVSDRNHEIIYPFTPLIIDKLQRIETVSIQRAFLAILINSTIPEDYHGELLQFTSEILLNAGSPVASIIYSADIFYKLSIKEPELLNELKLMLEYQLPFGSAGVKSKCRKIIKKIEKSNPKVLRY